MKITKESDNMDDKYQVTINRVNGEESETIVNVECNHFLFSGCCGDPVDISNNVMECGLSAKNSNDLDLLLHGCFKSVFHSCYDAGLTPSETVRFITNVLGDVLRSTDVKNRDTEN